MDIGRLLVFLAALIVTFCAAAYIVLTTPSLPWVVVHNFESVIWPTALGLLVIVIAALVFLFIPYGKRVIAASPHKRLLGLSYVIFFGYAYLGAYSSIMWGPLIWAPLGWMIWIALAVAGIYWLFGRSNTGAGPEGEDV